VPSKKKKSKAAKATTSIANNAEHQLIMTGPASGERNHVQMLAMYCRIPARKVVAISCGPWVGHPPANDG